MEHFVCPKCSMVSFNQNDIQYQYCGNCHEFFLDLQAIRARIIRALKGRPWVTFDGTELIFDRDLNMWEGVPTDLAENHDHYLYGASKKEK